MQDLSEWACIYIKYIQILRKLETAYDQMVHPQKRLDMRKALEACIGRMLEVRNWMVKLNKGIDFVSMDDILVDLKLTAEVGGWGWGWGPGAHARRGRACVRACALHGAERARARTRVHVRTCHTYTHTHTQVLEVPVPKYFIEDRAKELDDRDKFLEALVDKYDVSGVPKFCFSWVHLNPCFHLKALVCL